MKYINNCRICFMKNKLTINLFLVTLILYSLTNIISSSPDSASFRDVLPTYFFVFLTMVLHRAFDIHIDISTLCYFGITFVATTSTFLSSYVKIERTILTFFLFMLLTVLLFHLRYTDIVIEEFTNYYIAFATICALLIIASWLAGIEHTWHRYSIGITGLNKNPNYINSIILMGFALLLYKICAGKRIKLRYIIGLLIQLCGVALTGTRAAILTIVFCVIFTIIYQLFVKRRYIYFLYIAVGLFFIVLVFNYIIPESISERYFKADMLTDNSRMIMWETAFREFLKHPLLGLGLGGTTINNAKLGLFMNIHNVLLNFLCDCGSIAAIFLLIIWFRIVKRTQKEHRFLIYILAIALYFPILFQNGVVGYTFWWPLAVLEIYSRWSQNKNKIEV